LVASKRVGPNGLVDAIEPEPAARARLGSHVALNGCLNVRIFDYAISNRSGTEELHLSPSANRGKHSLRRSNVTLGLDEPSPGSTMVRTRTLDEHLGMHARQPDVVKIDVEGAELLVLEGAQRSLSRDDSPIILFEASELLTTSFGYSTTDLKMRLA